MKNIVNKKLSQIVTENLQAAHILERHHIDFCCGGDKTLGQACKERGIEPNEINSKLKEVMSGSDSETEFIKNMDAAELSDYIIKRHHAYVKENIPALKKYLKKVNEVHGINHPELHEVMHEFYNASEALTNHMNNEETILFPYIREMTEAKNESRHLNRPKTGSISNPISQMFKEHENEGARFDRLAEITNNFSVPEDACNTFKLTYNQLNEFKSDLHKHIHLENNILFQEAQRLEKEIVKK